MRTAGALGSENAGVSSASWVRIPATDCLRFSGEGSSSQSKSGPKARLKSVVDGQQVDIPVLLYVRTVGTQKGRKSRERKDRCKRGVKSLRKNP